MATCQLEREILLIQSYHAPPTISSHDGNTWCNISVSSRLFLPMILLYIQLFHFYCSIIFFSPSKLIRRGGGPRIPPPSTWWSWGWWCPLGRFLSIADRRGDGWGAKFKSNPIGWGGGGTCGCGSGSRGGDRCCSNRVIRVIAESIRSITLVVFSSKTPNDSSAVNL
jgi:hypothetical protein